MHGSRKRPRTNFATNLVLSSTLTLLVASSAIRGVRQWLEPEQPAQQHHQADDAGGYIGFLASAAAVPKQFVDDGMFDPRRDDYWTNTSAWSTPASSNWASAARNLAPSSACGTASSSNPCCIECFGLSYCNVLNGYKVEDKYFPGEATILGSCDNFEDRASRLEVFGPSKTFRDTEACREMVVDYTCLWWGSANEMYDNRCGVEAQVYPCRSFCVQLAKICANNIVEWQELCRNIHCPPTDEECMPGPYTQDPDEACYIYEYHSPLNAGRRTCAFSSAVSGICVAFSVMAVAIKGAGQ